ncbi:MAG: hypothetical protein KC591_10290, partial [Gemmatimonadetes bacterium]|nr:hypothetical protein [Gemmatimonadota bacterium]
RAPARDPAVVRALEEASSRIASGRPEDQLAAAETLRGILASDRLPEEIEQDARFGLARAELFTGRRWAAIWQFTWLVHEHPDHAGALSALGLLAYEDGRWEDVLAPLASLARQRALTRDELVAFADASRRRNRFELADSLFTVQLEHEPQDAMSYRARGTLRRRVGDLAGAISDFERAVEFAPRDLFSWVGLADAQSAAGETAARRVTLDYLAAGEFDPAAPADSARADVLRARAALDAGSLDEARTLADRAVACDSTSLDALQLLVRIERARGNRDAARRAAETHRRRLAEIENASGALAVKKFVQAAIALEAADSTAALSELADAIREDPEFPYAYALFAPLARELGRSTDARAAFTRLREMSGGHVPGPIFLAAAYDLRERGVPAVAASLFDFAAGRLPGDEEPICFAAISRLEAGDVDGAVATAAPLTAARTAP